MSTAISETISLPTTDELRTLARTSLQRCGVDPNALDTATAATTITARTPVTGADLFDFPAAGAAQVEAAIDAAHAAFLRWRTVPGPVRGQLIKRLGELLTEHKADVANLISIEVGKITSEALGEVQEMIDICDFAVGLSRQLDGRTMPSERPGHRLMETWHPLGVVGVVSAFNFPAAVWSWNTAIAIVCGDAVVWKPAQLATLTAAACSALFDRAAREVRRAGEPQCPRLRECRRHPGPDRQPQGAAHQRHGLRADGRADRAARRRAVRSRHPGTGRQQRCHRHAVGRPRLGHPRHRVRRGRHCRAALHPMRRVIVHEDVADELVRRSDGGLCPPPDR